MREVVLYRGQNCNLCSIKSIDASYQGRTYLISLIEKLLNLTDGQLFVEFSRPNYNVSQIVEKLMSFNSQIKNLSSKLNFQELSFVLDPRNCEYNLLDILSQCWFAFEHGTLCFFLGKQFSRPSREESWYEITQKSSSFVMFKGIEEDVIWIGKSDDLEFNLGNQTVITV